MLSLKNNKYNSMDDISSRENGKLKELLYELKSYITQYNLLPVLAKAFKNDNFVFTKSNGIRNDDYLLAGYIADLYYSFQNRHKTDKQFYRIFPKRFLC